MALVTGGGIRVGAAITRALADAGATVAIHHQRSAREARALARAIERRGGRAATFAADLRDGAARAALVADVRRAFGGLDVLVNNAAGFERRAFETLDEAAVASMMALNFEAPLQLTRHALPALRRRRGVVVNVLDVAAFHAWRGYVHYGASKAALAMATRALALELAPRVRVAGVAPGTVMFPADYPAEDRRRIVGSIPLGRVGRPEDVAAAVLFLATNDYVTGTVIAVDGGRLAGSRLPL